ncbi:MAG: TRAP transporter large permease [Deltaproteobacteria bacterium]|nr:TRAP transporter large permease [Deltaproteobacteria bacterium]
MIYFVFFGILLFLIALGVPIAYSLGLSACFLIVYHLDLSTILVAQHMFAAVDSFSFLAIPFFMLAGALMSYGGVTKRLINFAHSLVGSFKGGLAQVVGVSGMFFGAISGSSAATTAAIGSIMIDSMEKKGYARDFTAGVIAAGGMVGIVIPPSITLVVYGVIAGASIGDLFMGGFGPGILFGCSMTVLSYFLCRRRGWGGEGTFHIKNVIKSFLESFWALLMPVIILGGIYGGVFTPTEAAAVASVYALVIGFFVYRELKIKDIPAIIKKAVYGTTVIMFIVATAQVFGWILTNAEIPQQIGAFVAKIAPNKYVFLVYTNIVLLMLGTMVNPSAAVVILTPILLPIANLFGIDSIFFGVLMISNLAIGNVTPPVGLDLFVVSAITKISMDRITRAMFPYLVILIIDLFIITFVPQIIMFLPNLMK